MSVKITSEDGRVTITADDSSCVSGVTIDGERVVTETPTSKALSIAVFCASFFLGCFLYHLLFHVFQ